MKVLELFQHQKAPAVSFQSLYVLLAIVTSDKQLQALHCVHCEQESNSGNVFMWFQ